MEESRMKCNICGEEFIDQGTLHCPFCDSKDIDIIADELEGLEDFADREMVGDDADILRDGGCGDIGNK